MYVLPISLLIINFVDIVCSFFGENLFSGYLIKLISIMLAFFIIVFFHKIHEKNQIKFGPDGLKIPDWENKSFAWEKLRFIVKDRNLLNIFPVLRLHIEHLEMETYVEYDLSEIRDFLKLIKSNCPQEHELYKVIEEYAKVKKLPF
jgi:hypothetical protein